jgi:MoxR-like ATPase
MINASNVSPGRAIERCFAFIDGNIEMANDIENGGSHEDILSLYFEGEPGVGKSAVAKALARKMGYKFEDIRANMLNPDDAGGTRMQDMETRTTAWFPPDWMPNVDGTVEGINDDKKSPFYGQPWKGTFLFFDELASADDRVRKPLFGVFLDRILNGRKLPNNCIVAAAGNEADTGTMVFELDNATRTRFITLRIIADFASWESDYAATAAITPTVVSYLKQNMQRFCETERALGDGRSLYGNPRSWEHVSKAERSIMRKPEDRRDEVKRDALHNMVAGKVGTELAAEYMGVFDNVAEMANLYDLLKASKEERKKLWPNSIGQLYALTYSMMSWPTDIEQAKKVMDLSKEMPTDSDIPFQEMRAPLLEVLLKRLKALGIKGTDVAKAFKQESEESAADIFANGPLIKLG